MEWKKLDSRRTSNYHLHRCIDLRLGCVPGELRNSWQMVRGRQSTTHQCSRTKGSLVRPINVQRSQGPVSSDSNKQYDLSSLYQSSGRYHFRYVVKNSKRDVVSLLKMQHSSESLTYSRFSKCDSRSSITDETRQT